jgi:hypothetical protein
MMEQREGMTVEEHILWLALVIGLFLASVLVTVVRPEWFLR